MFRFQRFYSIFKARNKEFYRDIGALTWTFFFPFMMIISFSYIFQIDDRPAYKAAYLGEKAPAANELIQWIPYESFDKAHSKLRYHQIDLIVDTEKSPPEIWLNESSTKSKAAETIFLASQDIKARTSSHITQGQKVGYVDWLFPGLIAMNILWLSLWGVGWAIVRHRKLGILKRYKASPLSPLEYLLAQMSSRLIILIITGVLVFAGAHLIYPFQTQGSYIDLFAIYLLGCVCHSTIGMLIAARIASEELANGFLNVVIYPIVFLSEIWFSLEGSADWVVKIAYFNPLWHMTDAMRRIMLEGTSLSELGPGIFILTTVSLSSLLIGAISFRWTAD